MPSVKKNILFYIENVEFNHGWRNSQTMQNTHHNFNLVMVSGSIKN